MNPICMSCRRIPGVKQIRSINGKQLVWRCQACINRSSVSFLKKDSTRGYKK